MGAIEGRHPAPMAQGLAQAAIRTAQRIAFETPPESPPSSRADANSMSLGPLSSPIDIASGYINGNTNRNTEQLLAPITDDFLAPGVVPIIHEPQMSDAIRFALVGQANRVRPSGARPVVDAPDTHAQIRPTSTNLAQDRPTMARKRPDSARFKPNVANLGQLWPRYRPTLVMSRPILGRRRPDPTKFQPGIEQRWHELGAAVGDPCLVSVVSACDGRGPHGGGGTLAPLCAAACLAGRACGLLWHGVRRVRVARRRSARTAWPSALTPGAPWSRARRWAASGVTSSGCGSGGQR